MFPYILVQTWRGERKAVSRTEEMLLSGRNSRALKGKMAKRLLRHHPISAYGPRFESRWRHFRVGRTPDVKAFPRLFLPLSETTSTASWLGQGCAHPSSPCHISFTALSSQYPSSITRTLWPCFGIFVRGVMLWSVIRPSLNFYRLHLLAL